MAKSIKVKSKEPVLIEFTPKVYRILKELKISHLRTFGYLPLEIIENGVKMEVMGYLIKPAPYYFGIAKTAKKLVEEKSKSLMELRKSFSRFDYMGKEYKVNKIFVNWTEDVIKHFNLKPIGGENIISWYETFPRKNLCYTQKDLEFPLRLQCVRLMCTPMEGCQPHFLMFDLNIPYYRKLYKEYCELNNRL